MIQLTKNNTEKATEKARKSKPLVRFNDFRNYTVKNKDTGAAYAVRFDKIDGKPYGECNCKAGQQEKFVCYHIASALPHHLMVAAELINQ